MLPSLIALLFSIQPALADPMEVSLGQIVDDRQNIAADIAYTSFVPVFEEHQDPAKSVRIEIYFAEDDQSENSNQRIAWFRSQLKHDLKDFPKITTHYEAVGKSGDSPEGNDQVKHFWSELGVSEGAVQYETIPNDVHLEFADHAKEISSINPPKDAQSRKPSAVGGRAFWSAVRFTSSLGATFMGLYYGFHVAPETALLMSIVPAIGSAGVSYYSTQYGRYLIAKNWSKAIVDGSNPFAKSLQKVMRVDPASLAKKSEADRLKVLSRLEAKEEVLRWYITEFIFTAGFLKLPQRIAGITRESVLGTIGSSFKSSLFGYLAQGPGDVAVVQRKIQKYEELRTALLDGEIQSPDKDRIVKELDEILDPKIQRTVDRNVHPMIQKIENWARSRGVIMSFVCVGSVVLDTVHVSESAIFLIGLGVAGGSYYAKVNGWFGPSGRVTRAMQVTQEKIALVSSKMLSLFERICNNEIDGDAF